MRRQTRNAGVRMTRDKLLRFTRADRVPGHWVRNAAVMGIAAWLGWVLFFSDHSAYHLLHLHEDKARLEKKNEAAASELTRVGKNVPSDRLTLEDKELMLRGLHIYARDGEIVYIFGSDSL